MPALRRAPRRLAALAGLLLAAGSALPVRAEPAASVILLSLDGVRYDQPGRDGLPALARLAQQGARAEALVPIFPANTFPNHVALATGAPADRHGILANRFRDRARGEFDYSNDASWIEAEPLWVAAERQGVRSAAFFWVGSETDWRGVGASYRIAPFDGDVGEAKKVDQLLAWLDLPEARRPRLLLSWWHGADSAGHRHGPDAAQTRRALAAQDRQLGRLLAGLDARALWDSTTLLVVSDHGMAEAGETVDAEAALRRLGIRARVYSGGGSALVYLDDPMRSAEARAALDALEGVEAHAAGRLPARLRYEHPTRTPDLVLLASPPHVLGRRGPSRLASWLFRRSVHGRGAHGYDPAASSEMAGIFLALGRGVPAGARLGRVSVLDVAPTVARLLGIEPPRAAEGAALPGLGAAPAAGDSRPELRAR